VAPDGRWLVVAERNGDQRDVSLAFLGSDSISFREYLRTPSSNEFEGAIAPNGRWMAYTSAEVDAAVVVRDFPEPTGQWRVSRGDGYDPVWAPDASALFFVTPPNLMRVDVAPSAAFSFRSPTVVFQWVYDLAGETGPGYDIHPDGDRFVVATGAGGERIADVYVVTNWFEELRERMGR
jgi:hypothetical protein